MIQSDVELELAQDAINKIQRMLVEARRTHSPDEYRLMSAPFLLELQDRQYEVIQYLAVARTPS
jgi:hypothetical protein